MNKETLILYQSNFIDPNFMELNNQKTSLNNPGVEISNYKEKVANLRYPAKNRNYKNGKGGTAI